MRILMAEDDETSRLVLATLLGKWGYETAIARDGDEAWQVMQEEDAPRLAILDRMMPGIDGVELCRRARQMPQEKQPHIILLTALGRKEEVIAGLDAGADDYVVKPFSNAELRARIQVARRIIELQQALRGRVKELETAIRHIKTLQGVIPICMHCHKIRQDGASWQRLEEYVQAHTGAEFSHGLCDECLEKYYPEDNSQEKETDLSTLLSAWSEEDEKTHDHERP